MMRVPEIRDSLVELGGDGIDRRRIAEIARAWVSGRSVQDIAATYFSGTPDAPISMTDAITATCKAIYRHLTNAGTWGLSALSKLSPGIDFDKLSAEMQRRINSLPAMLYHGVHTDAGVVMRMNSVPRTVAENLGAEYASRVQGDDAFNARIARQFLRELSRRARSPSGSNYRE
jgi:hypothetical protein